MMVISISHAHEARAKSIVARTEHWSHTHIKIPERVELAFKGMGIRHKGAIACGSKGRKFI